MNDEIAITIQVKLFKDTPLMGNTRRELRIMGFIYLEKYNEFVKIISKKDINKTILDCVDLVQYTNAIEQRDADSYKKLIEKIKNK